MMIKTKEVKMTEDQETELGIRAERERMKLLPRGRLVG